MQPENLEPRVDALEGEMRLLRGRIRTNESDAAAARVLAGAADRDVDEIRAEMRDFRRATVASINALREDMTDMRADLTGTREGMTSMRDEMTTMRQQMTTMRQQMNDGFRRVHERFAVFDGKFDQVDNGFAEMRAKFDITAAGQQRIAELIQSVIDMQCGPAAG